RGFQAVPLYARRPFDTPTSCSARNIQLSDRFTPSPDLSADFSLTHHENDQRLGTFLNTNTQSTTNYVARLRRTFGTDTSLTGTLFHGDSRFVTRNPTVT